MAIMERWLKGTLGFSYKYLEGQHGSNLDRLAWASGVGRSFVTPSILAARADGARTSFSLYPLLRRIHEAGLLGRGKSLGLDRSLGAGLRNRQLKEVRGQGGSLDLPLDYVAENIVELLCHIDEASNPSLTGIYLRGRASYKLRRSEWLPLLASITRALAAGPKVGADLAETTSALLDWLKTAMPPLIDLSGDDFAGELARITGRKTQARARLDAPEGEGRYLPFMALCILAHAVKHDLDLMSAAEIHPGLQVSPSRMWQLVLTTQRDLLRDKSPAPRAAFARGLIHLLQGDEAAAKASLLLSRNAGCARAARYLA